MATFAGKQVTIEQIKATTGLLRHYRGFLDSGIEHMGTKRNGVVLSRAMARQRLAFLIHTAINRKAGIPDVACRKQESDYQIKLWRDCTGVRDAVNRRRRAWGLNGRRWETDEIQARYGHLLDQ
jgi:hypothetical protein